MKLSIITVVLNDIAGIQVTLESVCNQTNKSFEYIVVDGGSTDGTRDIIEASSECIDQIIFKKDNGISEAFNNGIAFARGDYILLLNSGDVLHSNHIVEDVFGTNLLTRGYDVICTAVKCENTNKIKYPDLSNPGLIPHQGAFIGRHVYSSIGLYRTGLKLRMDLDLFIRIRSSKIACCTHGIVTANYASNGRSALIKNRKIFYSEAIYSFCRCGYIPPLGDVIRFLYWMFRSLIR